MKYEAKILADSLSPDGVRLTTLQCVYPRFIHAEVLRHRVQSHSVMSSRAVPTEKLIEIVRDPDQVFVPETFNQRVKGMGYGDALDPEAAEEARSIWLFAAKNAASSAGGLAANGVDKSRANRLLEPFLPVVDIITATEWSNFFALRQPSNNDPVPQQDFPAQPEFQIFARMAREAMAASKPEQLSYGQWHLPKVEADDLADWSDLDLARISAGRCAKVSFATHEIVEDGEGSLNRQGKLIDDAHWSPSEHTARPISPDDLVDPRLEDKLMISMKQADTITNEVDFNAIDVAQVSAGNFKGWLQLRQMYPLEHDRGEWLAQNAG